MICSSKSKGVIMKSLTKKLEIIESRNIVFFPVFARMNSFILNLGNRAFSPLFPSSLTTLITAYNPKRGFNFNETADKATNNNETF